MTLPELIHDIEQAIGRIRQEASREDRNDLHAAYLVGKAESYENVLHRLRGLEMTVTLGREMSRN